MELLEQLIENPDLHLQAVQSMLAFGSGVAIGYSQAKDENYTTPQDRSYENAPSENEVFASVISIGLEGSEDILQEYKGQGKLDTIDLIEGSSTGATFGAGVLMGHEYREKYTIADIKPDFQPPNF